MKNVKRFMIPLLWVVFILGFLATGALGAVEWNTSTVGLKVVADVDSITPTNRTLNLGIMGLDELGNVDIYGEAGGSNIIAAVTSLLGNPSGGGTTPGTAKPGSFAAATRYYRLNQGQGLANITYPNDASGTDTVTVTLYERRFDEGGNAMTREIASKVLTIPVEPAAAASGILNIESFTKASSDTNGVSNAGPANPANEAADKGLAAGAAKMTAGVAGGTFQIKAYRISSSRAYTLDANASGTVTLTLTGFNTATEADGGNRAQPTDTYTFTGTMANGVANIVVGSTVTKAGRYKVVATMGDLTSIPNKVSDKRDTRDFIDVIPVDQVASVSLSVDRSVVSNTGAANVKAANGVDGFSFDPEFTATLLDPYGNKIRNAWSPGATVKVTDSNYKIADFNIPIAAGANSGSLPVDSSAFTQGLASLTASVPANPLIAASDPVNLKIVANTAQLITNADGTNNPVGGLTAVTAGSVITDFLQVGLDASNDGTPDAAGTELTKLTATDSIKITSLTPLADGTYESITVAVKDNNPAPDTIDALFTKVLTRANLKANGFMIEDPNGSYAAVKYLPATNATFAVNPAAPNKAYVKNANGDQVTEITPVVNANGTFTVTINGARVSMVDSYGNSNPQGTLTITTTKGTSAGTITPGRGATSIVLTYPAGTTGEDELTFNFTQPGISGVNDGNGVKVVFPAVSTLDHFDTYTGATELPINAIVPLTIIPRTSSGSAFTVPDGYFVEYDTAGLTLQTAGGGAFASGSNVGANTGRAVFRVIAKTTPGTYKVTIKDASGSISKEVTYEVREYTAPLSVSDSAITIEVGSTAHVTISGGAAPYSVESADTSIVTASVSGTDITLTGIAAGGPVDVTVTDANNDSVTVAVTVTTAAPAPQPVPSGQNVTELSGADRANAPFTFGSVVTGGDTMELAVNFPAYEAGVDIYVALYIPNLGLYFVDESGALTSDVVAYRVNVTDAVQATIVPEFQVCPALSGLAGTWGAYTLVVPTNNGDLSGLDWETGDYDLEWYNFDVNCQ